MKQERLIKLKNNLEYSILRLQPLIRFQHKGIGLVTGCPRSGTSAMITWLHKNKGVARFFEARILVCAHHLYSEVERFIYLQQKSSYFIKEIRKFILNYYASQKLIFRKQIIDKEPLEPIAFPKEDYGAFLAHTRKIFPEIKILFIVRNPINTIWSMMNREWGYSLSSQNMRHFTLEECIRIWNANALLAVQYATQNNVQICRFEELIDDPIKTSNQILNFFDLRNSEPFEPKPTKSAGFSEEEIDLIDKKTLLLLEKLDHIDFN